MSGPVSNADWLRMKARKALANWKNKYGESK